MDYIILKQTGKKRGISPRMINYYFSSGRIIGAEKPFDLRCKDRSEGGKSHAEAD